VQIGEKKYFVSDLLALVLIVSGGLTILVAKLT
jgi:hypothetical protein